MVFSSILFLFYFLAAVLLIYFIVPKSWRNWVLFLSSMLFYAWGEPVYVLLMLFTITLDYACGRLVGRYKQQGDGKRAKRTLVIAMVLNLLLLGFFKYTDFLIGSVNGLFGLSIPLLNLPLPIGISFYTFQTMSYVVDVYRGDTPVQKNFVAFGAYVSLFPQLIAGPIVRYKTIAEQLDDRTETMDQFAYGVRRFMLGLGKKVLLANNIGVLWSTISAMDASTMPVLTAWVGIIAYSFQIYFDFSGYSDMAIGLGKMFGFTFLENFDHPYISTSITEFWNRWHISLSTWFKEYVYIPLGGNRRGLAIQIRNICIVWALTGIWHGASWNFLLWGVYFGILLILEKTFLLKWLKKAPSIVGHVYCYVLVLISWVFFNFESVDAIFGYIGAMFGAGGALLDSQSLYLLTSNLVLLVIAAVGCGTLPMKLTNRLFHRLGDNSAAVTVIENVVLVGLFVLCTAFVADASYNPFLYFRF